MNKVIQNMLSRKSVKNYKSDAVPNELLEQIIQAGLHAPSGRNKQAPIILAVTNKEIRDKLSKINAGKDPYFRADPFYNAPCVLVVLADKSVPTYVYDGSLVMENMLLAAEGLDIGSCWLGLVAIYFSVEENLKKLHIPEGYTPLYGVALGYKAEPNEPNPRSDVLVNWLK